MKNIINDLRNAAGANKILSFTSWLIFIFYKVLYLIAQQSYNLESIKTYKEKHLFMFNKNIYIDCIVYNEIGELNYNNNLHTIKTVASNYNSYTGYNNDWASSLISWVY